MKRNFKICLLFLLILLGLANTSHAAFTINQKWFNASTPTFFIDDDVTPNNNANYAAYQITSTVDVNDVWVKVDTFTNTADISLTSGENGIVHLGKLTAGTPKTAYFHLMSPRTSSGTRGTIAISNSHTLRIYDSNPSLPGSMELTNQVFTLSSIEDTISASSNKVTSVTVTPSNPVLGGTVTITVTGETGTVTDTSPLVFSPASDSNWPADKFKIQSSTITSISGSSVPTLVDQLYGTTTGTANTTYTATYIFFVNGTTSTNTTATPNANITSGGNMKHTSSTSSVNPIPPAANKISMTMLTIGSCPYQMTPAGGTVTYTLRFTNSDTTSSATVESIVDTLPASVTYAGDSKWNAVAIPDPDTSGSNLYWSGTFTIPASSSRDFTFQATIPATAGTYTNSAYAKIGSEQIDTTEITSDNSPATCAVTVLAKPTITKSFSPATIAPNGTSTVTLTLNNSNNVSLTNVAFTDTLPTSPGSMVVANPANPSNTCGGTLTATAGSGTISLSGGTINASGSCTVTVDVTAPTAGDYSNTVGNFSTAETASQYTVAPATLSVVLMPIISKSFSPTSIPKNGTSLLTITITNPDTLQITNVAFTDTYPANLVNANPTGAATTCSSGTVTASTGGGSVALSGATILPNSSCAVTVNVTSAAASSYTNTIPASALTCNEGKTNISAASATLPVLDPPTVAKSFTPNEIELNGTSALTITLTNSNSTAITGAAFTDTYPSNLVNTATPSGATTCTGGTVTATAGGSSVALSGGTIPASGSCTVTVNVTSSVEGSYLNNTGAITTTNAGNGSPASATLTVTTGVDVSGTVYNDANHNGGQEWGESGTGQTLYVKLVSRTGFTCSSPASAAASVNSSTGAYTLTGVSAGDYCLILDTNNTLSDTTPTYPSGWIGIEMPDGVRYISVGTIAMTLQDFGLYNGSKLTGKVFKDTGSGGGTANDGTINGSESGISWALVKLTNDAESTTYESAYTNGNGDFTLYITGSISNGTYLKVIETNTSGYVSTGAQAGTTGGAYTRTSDTLRFSVTSGTSYSGVNFGDVPENSFLTDGAQTGLSATVLFYTHLFTAGSVGAVTFSTASNPVPAISGWSEVLYQDSNCNAQLDAGEPQIIGSISMTGGQQICIILKEFIPANAPFNAQNKVTVSAQFAYTNASPALNTTHTRTDLTTVGQLTDAGLNLVKTANSNTALPGATLTYTITYTNNSNGQLYNIVINDSVTTFTTYVSGSCGALGAGLTGCAVTTQPPAGGTGGLAWTLSGSLNPGGTGTVSFSVQVEP